MIAYKLKYVLKPQMREESAKELRKCNKNTIRGSLGSVSIVSFPCTSFKFQ